MAACDEVTAFYAVTSLSRQAFALGKVTVKFFAGCCASVTFDETRWAIAPECDASGTLFRIVALRSRICCLHFR
jgi:hypothetical protein